MTGLRHSFVPLAKHVAGQDRRDQHREDQRAQQGEGHRPRHRPEEPAFDALQSEDRQVGRDDDAIA